MNTKLLCIETSTEVCSVVLADDGKVIDNLEDTSGMNHSKKLTQFIDDILKRNQMKAFDIDAIAVSEGPGSYTGLRIGVSAAKGICYATNKPLIAINPLHAMTNFVLTNSNQLGISLKKVVGLVPMIDARRMEVYRAVFDNTEKLIESTDAVVVDQYTFADKLNEGQLLFFGNGSAKCKSVIQHSNAVFIDGITTSARHMVNVAVQKYNKGEFVDVAYFEPFYLKDFIATIPKKNILG